MSATPARNERCPCGSGKKYKACCGRIGFERPAAPALTATQMSQLVAMMNAGRHAELERSTLGLLDQHPHSGVLWQLLGVALRMQAKDALDALARAATLLPQDAAAHNNLGNALGERGRYDDAVTSYRRALALRPDFAEAHNNLGNALLDLGQLEPAAASYGRALEIKPDYIEAYGNLGNALRGLGRLDEAVGSYRRALALSPESAEAHNELGMALRDLGRPDEAVESYRRALALSPDYAEAHSNLGVALRLQGRTAEAEVSCRRALAINPDLTATVVALAELHADRGHFAQAQDLFQRAISMQPQSPEAWAGIARLRTMTASDAAWLAEAQRIAGQKLPARQEVLLRYAIGKYFDDLKDFEQAFLNYRRANELTKQYRSRHEQRQLRQAVDLVTQRYDAQWLSQARGAVAASSRPVFIVGMLRSGTSLAEQILASHPQVFGAGELTFWSSASGADEPLGKLADAYLHVLAQLSPDAARVIDKMPGNFLHLGLIHAALPNARIIHMRRNPIDTCLSIYFQHFEANHSYANDLADLAHAYSEYLRVMKHWRSTLPEQTILDVPYEGLVEDQEAWSRKMLDFIGLPWDSRCLDFERTERTVITASKWQVRQKINTSSVERWRHYEQFVGPLRALLQPHQPD
jgi:tetratricopeptide (TPR) repeat protein